jgi:hypothetical protein
MFFLSSQQLFSAQHHLFPPQFHTPTLPYWSPGYCTVSLVTSVHEACGGIPLSHHKHLQDNMGYSTVGLYSPVFPRPADPHSSRCISRSSDKDHYPRTHRLQCRRAQRHCGLSCNMRNALLRCCTVERLRREGWCRCGCNSSGFW